MHGPATEERITHRFATEADLERYYGHRQQQTLRAVVIEQGGEVAAVIGLVRHVDHVQFFSEFREPLRPYLRTLPVMRAVKVVQGLVRESLLPVYAMAQESEADAVRILTRLGFVHHAGDTYSWPQSSPSSRT